MNNKCDKSNTVRKEMAVQDSLLETGIGFDIGKELLISVINQTLLEKRLGYRNYYHK